MQTVAHKAFFAHLYDEEGVLMKNHGEIVFLATDGTITVIEPDMCNFLSVHGEIGIAQTQHLRDTRQGGAARLACTRRQEVR